MTLRPPAISKNLPFSSYLLISIFFIILVLVVGITLVDYTNTERVMLENEKALREQTEGQLETSFRTIDTGLKLFDDTLNRQMDQAFVLFMAEYERTGRDPSKMDLNAVKVEIEKNIVTKLASHISGSHNNVSPDSEPSTMDLYIINSSGVVEYSTFAPDVGLDFRAVIPYFYEYLTKIRLSEGFFPDRVVQEASTGNLRKYAYMPTPDHQYVLELGLTESVFREERKQLKYTDAVKEIQSFNPYLEEVRTFTTAKRLVGNRSYVPDSNLSNILDAVLYDRTSMVFSPAEGRTVKYLFIDLRDEEYAADMSLILELTYNAAYIQTALHNLVLFHLMVAILALLLASGFAILLSRSLTRPIRDIVKDVDIIAKGDLDHNISSTMGQELDELEQSINAMVEKMKGTILQLQDSEMSLRREEERYRAVVESQNEFITRFRPDGTHLFVNEAYCRYFGFNPKDIIGKKFTPNIPAGDQERVRAHFSTLTPEHPFSTVEHRIVMPDGEIRWQQWNDRAIFDPLGQLLEYQSVGRDITPRIQAEEELKTLYSELERRVTERTSQLEAANKELESFSYSVSHDLRSPLRAIDGYSRILLEEHREHLNPEDERYLLLVRKSAQQMAQLIDALLNFSRMGRESLTRTELSPAGIAREALDDLTDEIKDRQIEVIIDDLPPCSADPSMLKRVYYNLLSNSLKFTRERNRAEIRVGFTQEGGHTVYYVQDNGVGFEMRYVDKLFKVFQRLHSAREYEGTGVGLAIVHRIIERHGGRIWVESEKNKGTTFFFTLGEG